MSEKKAPAEMDFATALTKLENVLQQLERSDCPLEESLALFQTGMELVQFCRAKLNHVEGQVAILLQEAGEFVPFAEGEEHGF